MSGEGEVRAQGPPALRQRLRLRNAGARPADGAPVRRQFGGAALARMHGDLASHTAAPVADRRGGIPSVSVEGTSTDDTEVQAKVPQEAPCPKARFRDFCAKQGADGASVQRQFGGAALALMHGAPAAGDAAAADPKGGIPSVDDKRTDGDIQAKVSQQALRPKARFRDFGGRRAADGDAVPRKFGAAAFALMHGEPVSRAAAAADAKGSPDACGVPSAEGTRTDGKIQAKVPQQALRPKARFRYVAGTRAADGGAVPRQFGGAALALMHGEPAGQAAASADAKGDPNACSTAGDGDESQSRGSLGWENGSEAKLDWTPGTAGEAASAAPRPLLPRAHTFHGVEPRPLPAHSFQGADPSPSTAPLMIHVGPYPCPGASSLLLYYAAMPPALRNPCWVWPDCLSSTAPPSTASTWTPRVAHVMTSPAAALPVTPTTSAGTPMLSSPMGFWP